MSLREDPPSPLSLPSRRLQNLSRQTRPAIMPNPSLRDLSPKSQPPACAAWFMRRRKGPCGWNQGHLGLGLSESPAVTAPRSPRLPAICCICSSVYTLHLFSISIFILILCPVRVLYSTTHPHDPLPFTPSSLPLIPHSPMSLYPLHLSSSTHCTSSLLTSTLL